jgi:hypothetical protein
MNPDDGARSMRKMMGANEAGGIPVVFKSH